MLGQHARQDLGAEPQQVVGGAVDRDGVQARIAGDDLVDARRRGVGVVGGQHVLAEARADRRQGLEQLRREGARALGAAVVGPGRLGAHAVEAQVDRALEVVLERGDRVGDVVAQIAAVRAHAVRLGEQHLQQLVDEHEDVPPRRQRALRGQALRHAAGGRKDARRELGVAGRRRPRPRGRGDLAVPARRARADTARRWGGITQVEPYTEVGPAAPSGGRRRAVSAASLPMTSV